MRACICVAAVLALGATTGAARADDGNEGDAAKPAPESRALADVEAGGSVRGFFGLTSVGFEGAGSLGVERGDRVGGYLRAAYFAGTTAGLRLQTVELAATAEAGESRPLHFGGGLEAVYFRLTGPVDPGAIETLGAGLHLVGRYDFLRVDRHTAFLELRAKLDSLDTFHNPSTFWGLTLVTGLRF